MIAAVEARAAQEEQGYYYEEEGEGGAEEEEEYEEEWEGEQEGEFEGEGEEVWEDIGEEEEEEEGDDQPQQTYQAPFARSCMFDDTFKCWLCACVLVSKSCRWRSNDSGVHAYLQKLSLRTVVRVCL